MKPVYRLAMLLLMILLIGVMIFLYVAYRDKYVFLILVPIYILGKTLMWDIGVFSLFKRKDENKD